MKIFFLSCPYIVQIIQYLAFQRRVKKIFFLTVQEENYQYPVGWSDRTFLRFLKAGTLLPISYIFISSMTCLVVHACYRFYFQKISKTLNYFFFKFANTVPSFYFKEQTPKKRKLNLFVILFLGKIVFDLVQGKIFFKLSLFLPLKIILKHILPWLML